MRLITFFFVLIIGFVYAHTKKIHQELNLNGMWLPVKEEIGGMALPDSLFKQQQLIIDDSNYTFIAESIDKGIVRIKDSTMDVYGKEGANAGKHFTAIYKYQNSQLTICYNLKGNSYPTLFETSAGPTLFLCVFKKK